MIRRHFEFRSTIATVLGEDPVHIEVGCAAMIRARQSLERYIARDPFFRDTFEPYKPDSLEQVILRMADAAGDAGVGPMAAVAGAIAWAGVDAMCEAGATFAVIDNGGDIALISDRDIRIGLHAGSAKISDKCAFIIPPQDRVLGCCTSSATVGPSISLGIADAVTVFSPDVALADAWATRVCNEITPSDQHVLELPDPAKVTGIFVVAGECIMKWGVLPRMVRARVDERIITAGGI